MSDRWIKYVVVEWKPRLNPRHPREIKRIISRHKGIYAAQDRMKALGSGLYSVERW